MRGTSSPANQRSRIPLTVIVGTPGAGTSSLICHLLKESKERRIAAVVRSADAIDSTLIARRDGPRLHLHNGSLCVVADGDGAATLANLADAAERPDHVVFEGGEATDPRRLSGYGYMPGYSLDGTVVVLDAPGVCACANSASAESHLQEQLSGADVVLINKLDLIDEAAGRNLEDVLGRTAPAGRVVLCDHSRIAPSLLLGAAQGPDPRAVVAEWTPNFLPAHPRGYSPVRRARAAESNQCHSWCLMTDRAVDGREFRSWVQRLPSTILSGRGTVCLREEPQHRQVFHLLGARWRLERGAPWGRDVPSTQIRLVGLAGRRPAPRTADSETQPPFAGELA